MMMMKFSEENELISTLSLYLHLDSMKNSATNCCFQPYDDEDESLRVQAGVHYSLCGSNDRTTFIVYTRSGFASAIKVEMQLVSGSRSQNHHEPHSTDLYN